MITIQDSKIFITCTKEVENIFKTLKKFTGKDNNRPWFKDITFQPNEKKGFVFYGSFYDSVQKLPKETRLNYLDKLLSYMTYGEAPVFCENEKNRTSDVFTYKTANR